MTERIPSQNLFPSEGVGSSGSKNTVDYFDHPRFWGPSTWRFLHCVSLSYPKHPSIDRKHMMNAFLIGFCGLLPCDSCSHHCLNYILKNPLTEKELENMDNEIPRRFFRMHNMVNKRLEKPHFSYADFFREYKVDIRSQKKRLEQGAFPKELELVPVSLNPSSSNEKVLLKRTTNHGRAGSLTKRTHRFQTPHRRDVRKYVFHEEEGEASSSTEPPKRPSTPTPVRGRRSDETVSASVSASCKEKTPLPKKKILSFSTRKNTFPSSSTTFPKTSTLFSRGPRLRFSFLNKKSNV